MFHRIRQNRFATHWELSTEKLCIVSLFTGLGSFRLPFACINGSRACWAALWFVRRCEKMTQWMFRSKGGRFLLAWYSEIARKMGEIYTKRWSIFWRNHLLLFFGIYRDFLEENPPFILVHVVRISISNLHSKHQIPLYLFIFTRFSDFFIERIGNLQLDVLELKSLEILLTPSLVERNSWILSKNMSPNMLQTNIPD